MRSPKAHVGKFTPKHPEKYVGNINNIVFRSSWELKLFRHLDTNTIVKKWGSEEISVNYFDPVADKTRRYFPDVFVIIEQNGKQQKIMIEVKPFVETIKPTPKLGKNGKPTPSYMIEEATYATNTAKWEAAKAFCQQHNIKFALMTEYELGIKRR